MSQPIASSRLQEVVAMLADLRGETENLLLSVELATHTHADREFLAFMQLAVGNVAAIETLARAGVRFVMAGTAAARAAYEVVVTATWMVATSDLAERERRWMALFMDERKFWRRVVEDAIKQHEPDDFLHAMEAEVQRLDKIIATVQPQLDAVGAGRIKPMPQLDDLLDQIGKPDHYVMYKAAAQLVHPANRALAQVRDGQATHTEEVPVATYSYRTTERDWKFAIILGAVSLFMGVETLATWMKGPPISQRTGGAFNDILAKAQTL